MRRRVSILVVPLLVTVMCSGASAEEHRDRGLKLAALGRWREALGEFDDALQLDPKLPSAYNGRAVVHLELEEYRQALKDLDKAAQLAPGLASVRNNRGLAYLGIGDSDRALAELGQALALDDPPGEPYELWAVFHRSCQIRDARPRFAAPGEKDPLPAAMYINRGSAHFAKGSFLLARVDFARAINLEPGNAVPWLLRGLLSNAVAADTLDQSGLESALFDLTKAIELDPRVSCAYNARGGVENNLGIYQDALADYSQAIHLEPKAAEYYANRGFTYRALGRDEEALDDFDKAIEFDPANASAYSNRGSVFFSRGQYERALTDFDKAIELQPKFASAYSNRGSVLLQLGRASAALADFTRAIELEANDIFLAADYMGRATAYLQLHRPKDALADAGQAIRLSPQAPEAYVVRSRARAALGRYRTALEDLNAALGLTDDKKLIEEIHQLMAQLRSSEAA